MGRVSLTSSAGVCAAALCSHQLRRAESCLPSLCVSQPCSLWSRYSWPLHAVLTFWGDVAVAECVSSPLCRSNTAQTPCLKTPKHRHKAMHQYFIINTSYVNFLHPYSTMFLPWIWCCGTEATQNSQLQCSQLFVLINNVKFSYILLA